MGNPKWDSRDPMNPTSSMRTLLGGAVLLALAVGGLFFWWHGRAPVGKSEVEGYLDRTQGAGRLKFSVLRLVPLHVSDARAQVAVEATARTLVPLYVKVDTADYLRRALHVDNASAPGSRRIFGGDGVPQGTNAPEAGPLPEDPYRATVLQLVSPTGTTFGFQGIIDIHRAEAGVSLALASGGFTGPGPQGDPRSAYAGATYLAGDPKDDAKLATLVASLEGPSRTVAAPPGAPEPGKAAPNAERRSQFLADVSAGRIFRGVAVPAGLELGTTLYLEIEDVSPRNEVRALLRNEGGWISARRFQGTLNADDGLTLSLTSGPDQAIRGAGPFLEESQTWSFVLHPGAAPGLFGESRLYKFRFEPLGPQQASETIDRLGREFRTALQASRAGSLYIGTCTARDTGASESVLLRFASQADGAGALDARIEATSQSWKRRLHGMIVTNARRSGGEPIRLHADAEGAVGDAPADSIFGYRDDLDLRLAVDSGGLSGSDGKFTYRFAPATVADLERLEADRAARTARLLGVFRPGMVLDGSLREEQGFTSRARLEIESLDGRSGSLSARIVSLSRANVYRAFQGSLDPSGSVVVLNARARGSAPQYDDFDAPFFKTTAAATLLMSLSGNAITGRIEGDTAWAIEFPVGAFIAAQTKVAKQGPLATERAEYPPFPKERGAYLLTGETWSALPKNQGHVVVETVRPDSQLHLTLNLLDALDEGIGLVTREKEKQKVPYFEFDGKEPRPVASGPAITVLYVGPAPASRPPVELAPGELLKDGRRRILVMRPTPDTVSFGETRMAAYVRAAGAGCVLLTTTSAPAPGPYVFNADTGYELTVE